MRRFATLLVALLLALAGCSSPGVVKPGRTKLNARLVIVPAQLAGNHLLVELKWDKHGPWTFIVDTGASTSLVSPEFARRYASETTARNLPSVHVRSATGQSVLLTGVQIKHLIMGEARFDNVQALVYDTATLSAHFGRRIDGVLGFPLFRDTIVTLDYPQSRLLLTPAGESPLLPGATIRFNNDRRTPLIPVRIGDESFVALIDSGSDGALQLNPLGLRPQFSYGPRPGSQVSTLAGTRLQDIGRLVQPFHLGDYVIERPIVDLTDNLSCIGGEILRHFAVTFDQARSQVTFYHAPGPTIPAGTKRSTGLNFSKTAAYWRVTNVVTDSPAERLGISNGALVTRINGTLVSQWDLEKFDELVKTADAINFTFLLGRVETTERIPVFDLVP